MAFWDDDDLYSPNRLRNQLSSLLHYNASLSILLFSHILDLADERNIVQLYRIHAPHKWGPHFGTLFFDARVFRTMGVRFPNTSFAEDLTFVQRLHKLNTTKVVQK